MKNSILIAGAFGAVVLIVYLSRSNSGLFLDTPRSNVDLLHGLLYGVAMLGGIFAGRMHFQLSRFKTLNLRRAVISVWRDRELWKSLLASPIIFGVVYSVLSDANDVVLAVVFSFQNGFFCNSILEKKIAEADPST